MKKLKIALALTTILVVAGFLISEFIQPAQAIPTDSPDFAAIQTTLRLYTEIMAEAESTLDGSRLGEVLANDPRGGLVDPKYLLSVQYMTGRPDLKLEEIGFLDVNQARVAFLRRVKELFDQAIVSGELKITPVPTDNAILPTPFRPGDPNVSVELRATDNARRHYVEPTSPRAVPEIRALEQATGLGATLPAPGGARARPLEFTIESIAIEGDVAYARVDWEYGLCDDIFVKIDGRWYLAGHKVSQWHGG